VIVVIVVPGTVVIAVAVATPGTIVIVVIRGTVVIVVEVAHAIVPDFSPAVIVGPGADAFAWRAILHLDLDIDPRGAVREDHFDLAAARLFDL
jgi:hypothetical protein